MNAVGEGASANERVQGFLEWVKKEECWWVNIALYAEGLGACPPMGPERL